MNHALKLAALLPICAALAACGGGGGGQDRPAQVRPDTAGQGVADPGGAGVAGTDQPGMSGQGSAQTGTAGEGTAGQGSGDQGTPGTGATGPSGVDGGQSGASTPFQAAGSQRLADGVWFGSDDNGKPAFALVSAAADGERTQYFFARNPGAGYVAAFTGFMLLNQGAIGGGDVLADAGQSPLIVRGQVNAANTLAADFYVDAKFLVPQRTYRLNYVAGNPAPPLGQLQGVYARSDGVAPVTIDQQGRLSGKLVPGCEISGQLRPAVSAGAMYRLNLHVKPFAPFNCLRGGAGAGEADLTGVAALATLPNDKAPSFLFAATGTRPDGQRTMLAAALLRH